MPASPSSTSSSPKQSSLLESFPITSKLLIFTSIASSLILSCFINIDPPAQILVILPYPLIVIYCVLFFASLNASLVFLLVYPRIRSPLSRGSLTLISTGSFFWLVIQVVSLVFVANVWARTSSAEESKAWAVAWILLSSAATMALWTSALIIIIVDRRFQAQRGGMRRGRRRMMMVEDPNANLEAGLAANEATTGTSSRATTTFQQKAFSDDKVFIEHVEKLPEPPSALFVMRVNGKTRARPHNPI